MVQEEGLLSKLSSQPYTVTTESTTLYFIDLYKLSTSMNKLRKSVRRITYKSITSSLL